MKKLAALCLMLAASLVWAGEASAPPATTPLKGEVLEIKEGGGYTYLRLKTKDGETWAAVSNAAPKKGAQVVIENPMAMTNFESKSLNRTFPSIVFGSLAGTGARPPGAGTGAAMPAAHGSSAKIADGEIIKVPKAEGPNARTVAEVITKAKELKDKPVAVRGKVVKYNPEIMGKNWVHLRDGTGSAANNTNDLLVTTTGKAKVGDVVTVKGAVRTDKDFGSGYAYKVLIEDGTLHP